MLLVGCLKKYKSNLCILCTECCHFFPVCKRDTFGLLEIFVIDGKATAMRLATKADRPANNYLIPVLYLLQSQCFFQWIEKERSQKKPNHIRWVDKQEALLLTIYDYSKVKGKLLVEKNHK